MNFAFVVDISKSFGNFGELRIEGRTEVLGKTIDEILYMSQNRDKKLLPRMPVLDYLQFLYGSLR